MAVGPISIKLRCKTWEHLAAMYQRDLLRTALFLRSSSPPPIGTDVSIALTLPSNTVINLHGRIRAHVPAGGLEGRGPGIDIALHTVPQTAMWLIESALASSPAAAAIAAGDAERAAAQQASGADSPTNEADVDEGREVVDAESELLIALRQELQSLRPLNAFQVLGIGYDTDDDAVRSAFADLTRRYHPDRFARYQSAEARRLASEIFILIRDAYRRLGTERARERARSSIRVRTQGHVPATASTTIRGGPAAGPAFTPAPSATARTGTSGTSGARGTPKAAGTPTPTPVARVSSTRLFSSVPANSGAPPPAGASVKDTARARGLTVEHALTLIDRSRYDEAVTVLRTCITHNPNDRAARATLELAHGLKALALRDRLEAAQRFETVLEIDPGHERAARELANMRRVATSERKGLLSRLLGKKA